MGESTVHPYPEHTTPSEPWFEESVQERLNRNLNELLQELRIALPGVQILFAFLLAVPFQANFASVTEFQRLLYLITLILTATSAACLISPAAFHRITFHLRQKPRLLRRANILTISGLALLALAMTCAVTLVTSYLFPLAVAVASALFTTMMFVVLWGLIPIRARELARQEIARQTAYRPAPDRRGRDSGEPEHQGSDQAE